MSQEKFPARFNRYLGLKAGLLYAFVGSILFTITECLRLIRGTIDWWLPFAMIFLGWIFSFIPAGIGGVVLDGLLQNQMQKGPLTLTKATQIGVIVAGPAGCVASLFGVLFVTFVTMAMLQFYWSDANQGFQATFLNSLSALIPEILIAITISCIAGGWASRVLARRLLNLEEKIDGVSEQGGL